MNSYQRDRLAQDEARRRAPADLVVAMEGQGFSAPAHLLGPRGPIAKTLPGYSPRPSQIEVAETVWGVLHSDEPKVAVIEAGTGVGKSLGATVPAIAWAVENDAIEHAPERLVIISTAMKILQDQYIHNDMPFLVDNLGIPFRFAVMKGRGNYVCPNALETMDQGGWPRWHELTEWYRNTDSGDLGELPFEFNTRPLRKLLKEITVTSETCGGRDCRHYHRCPFFTAKMKAMGAHVLVVNHALLILNAWSGGKLLPQADALIIDEAHKLEDVTRGTLTTTFSNESHTRWWKKLRRVASGPAITKAKLAVRQIVNEIENAYGKRVFKGGSLAVDRADAPEKLIGLLHELIECLEEVRLSIRDFMEDSNSDGLYYMAESFEQSLRQLVAVLRAALGSDSNSVIWVERDKEREISLNIAPLGIGRWLQKNLFDVPTVLMSATLTTTGEDPLAPFCESMGLEPESTVKKVVGSPYDYKEQARYLLPRWSNLKKLPSKGTYDERTRAWVEHLIGPLFQSLCLTDGRSLCLFTSIKVMEAVHNLIREQAPKMWSLFLQGTAGKQELIADFKAADKPVLFATKSFFEGVDIPGEKLSGVIIDKIPFPGKDPVEDALREILGGFPKSLHKYDIPKAIIELKQAVGRLIRHEMDRGIITLCDPRLRWGNYRNIILPTLPGWVEPLSGAEVEKIPAWIAGTGPAPEYGRAS